MRFHTPKFIDELLLNEAKSRNVTVAAVVTERLAASYEVSLPPMSLSAKDSSNVSNK